MVSKLFCLICVLIYRYVYIYIYIYIYLYIYIKYICENTMQWLCICVLYIHIYIYVYVYVYVCIYVCMYIYIYICIYVCMYVCMCVYRFSSVGLLVESFCLRHTWVTHCIVCPSVQAFPSTWLASNSIQIYNWLSKLKKSCHWL